ncbi:putative SprT family Zn-dependent metalloprotease [Desulfohalotomaculum tongense]|uniref:hypothetical protein n=1 Tax=Desulforadius tongensis TaxID=1216062 RepID=UPI00195771A6|nr:hypothetical protein [Desulforadius tongensis]MBM7854116.1 putative SprT family Zn-dependent metalloprotease [Desulforadius tongensis]
MPGNWNLLCKRLNIDSSTIVFEKKSLLNDAFLGHLSGAMVPKTHVYIRSDVDPRLEEYIRAHELCHYYLIFEQGYYFFLDEKGTDDPLFSLIMSFSHHFTIDCILKDCFFDIEQWHQKQYLYCTNAARNGFSSDLDAVGKTLNLIELDYWLKNNAVKKLKKSFIKHNTKCTKLFQFAEKNLKEIIKKELCLNPKVRRK